MPRTRTLASRQTAKASGRILSSDSPLAMRCWNSGVLACNCSSLSACICGSSALIFLTMPPSCLSRRSLRLPKTLVSKRLNIVYPDGGPGSARKRKRARGAPFMATSNCILEPPAAYSTPLLQELAGVHHATAVPDFEVHVGAGGAAGGAGAGHFLAGAHQV